MYTVKIMNEYLYDPIWVYVEDGIAVWQYPKIDEDLVLNKLNHQAVEMFSSYYEFDSYGQASWFNKEKEKTEKDRMKALIQGILDGLNEINNGSFQVQDYETERLNQLSVSH